MMVNICVWDARFSAGCRNPDLLWPLNSLAYSLTSLHRLVFPAFCHLSFVISQHIHGSSSLPPSCLSPLFRIHGERACTHKHMSAKQKPHLAPGDFFFLRCYLERVQRYKAELCMPCECIERDYNKLLAWGCSILTYAHCTFIFLSQNKGGHC